MSDSRADNTRGIEMEPSEIENFLVEQGYGTLALASENKAYAVPISIGYDGERLHMNLITFGAESKKLEYVGDTEEACVVLQDVQGKFDWRTVVVTGSIREVNDDEADYHEEVLDDNGWFPVIYPPTDPMSNITHIVMEPTEMTGRIGD